MQLVQFDIITFDPYKWDEKGCIKLKQTCWRMHNIWIIHENWKKLCPIEISADKCPAGPLSLKQLNYGDHNLEISELCLPRYVDCNSSITCIL